MIDSHIGGLAVVKETIRLVFKYPILLMYALFLFVASVALHCTVSYNLLWDILLEAASFLLMVLINFCIARHTLAILCKQPITLIETVSWVISHIKQIVAWVLISGVVSLGLRLLIVLLALIVALVGIMSSDWPVAVSIFLVSLGAVLAALSLVVVVMITSGTPIVAAEQLPVRMVFKQIRYLWRRAGRSYMFAAILLILLSVMVSALMIIGVQLVLSNPNSDVWFSDLAPLFMFFITIANTLFYYHLYYKQERELAQDLSMHESMR